MLFTTEANQIVYRKGGRTLAFIHWTTLNAHTIAADHTFVDESLRGQGAAAQGWKIRAVCPFVQTWFARSGEYDGVKA